MGLKGKLNRNLYPSAELKRIVGARNFYPHMCGQESINTLIGTVRVLHASHVS